MKTKTIGIILIVLGALMMLYSGFNYRTTETIVDLGPVQINREKEAAVKWPSILGGIIIVGGIMTITLSKKNSS